MILRRKEKAFTLIELLIVVAIIAILAAIAVPNFLEAQTRSKVSRCKGDMRSLATAIEAYFTDYNHYPMHMLIGTENNGYTDPYIAGVNSGPPGNTYSEYFFSTVLPITTPIAYITTEPYDPFRPTGESGLGASNLDLRRRISFANTEFANEPNSAGLANWRLVFGGWRLYASGPDKDRIDVFLRGDPKLSFRSYDPTNGTVSDGDIIRTQKDPEGQRVIYPGLVE